MNLKTNTSTLHADPTRPRRLLNGLRDELADRRTSRANRRALERDLSTYRTSTEVDDLLGSMRGQEGPELDQIQRILMRNLQHHQRTGYFVS